MKALKTRPWISLALAGALVGSLAYFVYRRRRRIQVSDRQWDQVDQASWESFPASDSPGW